jgi:hypothetical protein
VARLSVQGSLFKALCSRLSVTTNLMDFHDRH